jgi:hypothetical protein
MELLHTLCDSYLFKKASITSHIKTKKHEEAIRDEAANRNLSNTPSIVDIIARLEVAPQGSKTLQPQTVE